MKSTNKGGTKKVPKEIISDLLDQYKHNIYNTNKSKNSQSNSKADSNKIKSLNIKKIS